MMGVRQTLLFPLFALNVVSPESSTSNNGWGATSSNGPSTAAMDEDKKSQPQMEHQHGRPLSVIESTYSDSGDGHSDQVSKSPAISTVRGCTHRH